MARIAEDEGIRGFNETLVIETALIAAPDRADNAVFGRPLLERLMINCERAGIKRFVVAASRENYPDVARAMGRFKNSDTVSMVESFGEILNTQNARELGIDPLSPCVSFSGNLVFAKSHLARILAAHASDPRSVHREFSTDHDCGGEIATGPISEILKRGGISNTVTAPAASLLPFALNGRPEDREEAELRLAKSIREESAHKDAPMARWVDRKISWRISYWLATHTRATPNMVTVANTMFGLACALMFSVPNYWMRLFAAIFFLISITIDGVDGELARLKMVESDFGGALDVVTDNIVHAGVFVGLLDGMLPGRSQPRLPVPDSDPARRLRDVRVRDLARFQSKGRSGGGVAGQGRSMERARFRIPARGVGLNQSDRVLRLGHGIRHLRVCPGADMDYRPDRIVNEG